MCEFFVFIVMIIFLMLCEVCYIKRYRIIIYACSYKDDG